MLQNKLLALHTNTEGLRQNFIKLYFIELSQNLLRQVVAIFFSQKSSKFAKPFQVTHLISMVFFSTPFENFDFSCFQAV